MSEINMIWDEVVQFGYSIRKLMILMNDTEFNIGQSSWGLLKDNFKKYHFINSLSETIKSVKIEKDFTKKINYIKKEDDDEHENVIIQIGEITLDNKIEHHHFFIQHYRIIIKEDYKLNVQKLMQIAFNVGQYKAHNELKPEDYSEIHAFYKENKLNDIETYIGSKKYTIKKNITGGYFKFNVTFNL